MVYSNWTAIEQLSKALDDARRWKERKRDYNYSLPFHMEKEREGIERRVKEAISYLAEGRDNS